MRYAFLSDIHGNLEALQSVIAECKAQGVRRYFCLGDIVGYGASPNECLEVLKDVKAEIVAGNHDWAVCGHHNSSSFNDCAKESILWTKQHLNSDYMKEILNFELVKKYDDFSVVHGSLNQPEQFLHVDDVIHTHDTFFLMDQRLCFVGNTHQPKIYIKEEDRISYGMNELVTLEKDKKYIVNVGSVGQPRDGNPKACYCIYDPDLERVEIKRVEYDVSTAQEKIVSAGLPEVLAKRLSVGQ